MERSPHGPVRRVPEPVRPHRLQRAGAVLAVVAAGALLVSSSPGLASPALPSGDPRTELAKLNERADTLTKQYKGSLVKLDEAKRAAQRAASRAERASRELARTRREVALLASTSYKSGSMDPTLTILMTGDPRSALDRAATVEHLARLRGERIHELRTLSDKERRAQRAVATRVTALKSEIDSLEKNRHEVERLIARFTAELPSSSSQLPSSSSQLPPGSGNITSRMLQVRNLVVERFGDQPAVGCYRPGGSGEHPLGRACDFMLSTGGTMPSDAEVQRGYDIASWAQANAEKLGIMYVIYRQRIWDIRNPSAGWRPMEDRGSITANHYDHVHISVF